MITEVQVPGHVRVKQIVVNSDHWIIVDEAGSIVHVDVPEISPSHMEFTRLLHFHSGGITAMQADRTGHSAVSGDAAGSIWAYDLRSQTRVCSRTFLTGVTCITGASVNMDTKETVYYVGHEGGFLRQLLRCTDGWHVLKCYRPHQQTLIAMALSPGGETLVTCGQDGSLFFFSVADNCLEPHALVKLSQTPASLVWNASGVVVGCENGVLLCVQPPANHDHNTAATFECDAAITQHTFMLPRSLWPQPPKKASTEDETVDPETKTGVTVLVERPRCSATDTGHRT